MNPVKKNRGQCVNSSTFISRKAQFIQACSPHSCRAFYLYSIMHFIKGSAVLFHKVNTPAVSFSDLKPATENFELVFFIIEYILTVSYNNIILTYGFLIKQKAKSKVPIKGLLLSQKSN